MASMATSRGTPPFSARATPSQKPMTSMTRVMLRATLSLHGKALRADVGDLGADGEEDGSHAFERGFVAGNHERGFALADDKGSAGNGSVQHGQSGFGEFGGDGAAGVRVDGAHVEVDGVLTQAGDDSVFAEGKRTDCGGVSDDGEG